MKGERIDWEAPAEDVAGRVELLRRAGLLSSPPEPAYDRLTRLARQATGAPIALFSLVGTDEQQFKSGVGLMETLGAAPPSTPIRQSLCRVVVGTDEPLVLEDAEDDPVFCDHPAVLELKIRAYLGYPVRAPDGTPLGSLCVVDTEARRWTEGDRQAVEDLAEIASREVALRLKVEEETRKAELHDEERSFLRSVLDALPAGTAILDPADHVVVSNTRWEELTRNPASGGSLGSALLADPEVRVGVEAVRAGAQEEFLWDRHRLTNGVDCWYQLRASLVRLEAGPHVLLRYEDLTRIREAESLLRLLREAVDHTGDYLLITEAAWSGEGDRGPRIVFANAAFLEETGYRVHEVVGKRLRLPSLGEADAPARLREAVRAQEPVRVEVRNRRKDGSVFWVDVGMVPIRDMGGVVTHWVSVQRDITERREQEQRLAEQEEAMRVQDRLEVAGRLAAGIAHDFNNLLTVVLSNVELLLLDQPESEAAPVELLDARKAAVTATGLTRQLLALSRRQVLVEEAVALDELVQEVASVLRGGVTRGLSMQIVVEGHLPRTWADPVQLKQVLLNLVLNARDAMEGQGRLLLSLRPLHLSEAERTVDGGSLSAGAYVEIRVEDSGPGVPAAVEDRIFEPFFTTKPLNEGRGLGLSTALGILRQMGGGLSVSSSESLGGACFVLQVPVRPGPASGPASGPA